MNGVDWFAWLLIGLFVAFLVLDILSLWYWLDE